MSAPASASRPPLDVAIPRRMARTRRSPAMSLAAYCMRSLFRQAPFVCHAAHSGSRRGSPWTALSMFTHTLVTMRAGIANANERRTRSTLNSGPDPGIRARAAITNRTAAENQHTRLTPRNRRPMDRISPALLPWNRRHGRSQTGSRSSRGRGRLRGPSMGDGHAGIRTPVGGSLRPLSRCSRSPKASSLILTSRRARGSNLPSANRPSGT